MVDVGTGAAEKTFCRKLSPSMVAFGIFLFFGATMAALAGTTLIWRGTILDGVWKLNTTGYKQLTALGRSVGILFFLLSGSLAVAGTGWFRRRHWGWSLAVAIIATQILGDLVNFFRGDFIRGGIGTAIGGTVLLYLFSENVKTTFASNPALDG